MLHIPYHQDTYKLEDTLVPGNSVSEKPVAFVLAPAWGPDLARIKSVIFASAGLVQGSDWSPEMQKAVTEAFDHGGLAFVNTIQRIDGLTIPAVMALRAGLIQAIPTRLMPGETVPVADPEAPVAVTNGIGFSRICGSGAVLAISMAVAMKVASLSEEAQIDPRFFVQPSGSGGPETAQATASTAGPAQPIPRRRGTAGKGGRKTGSTPRRG